MRSVRDRFSACTTTTPDVSCTSVTPWIAVGGRADIEYRRSDPYAAVGAADPGPERAHKSAAAWLARLGEALPMRSDIISLQLSLNLYLLQAGGAKELPRSSLFYLV
jgi:hypothetical protein